MGGHHPICWGPKWNKNMRKGKFSLLDPGCPSSPDLEHQSSWFSYLLPLPFFKTDNPVGHILVNAVYRGSSIKYIYLNIYTGIDLKVPGAVEGKK